MSKAVVSVRYMDIKLEVVTVPISDVDRAKSFYVDQVGFVMDHDQTVSDEIRFVQLTPSGSVCSIAFGRGISTMQPGSLQAIMCVVADVEAARAELIDRGVEVSDVDERAWGRFVYFADPDGNGWSYQQLPDWSVGAGGSGARPEESEGSA